MDAQPDEQQAPTVEQVSEAVGRIGRDRAAWVLYQANRMLHFEDFEVPESLTLTASFVDWESSEDEVDEIAARHLRHMS